MPVADLLKDLGYEGAPNFIQGSGLEEVAGYSYVFRRAKSTCHLHGVYTLSEKGQQKAGGTLVPLVYVCEATDKNPAPVIYQRVWNQNVAPFILVETRGNVYLYSGFRYDGPQDDSQGTPTVGVLRAVEEFSKNMRALESFRAEAIDEGALWREWEPQVTPQTRVDWLLLEKLEKLDRWLRGNHLKKGPAHALIGKYVFLRYLKDRKILSDKKFEEWGIKPGTVFGREATLAGFGRLVKRLDDWLNGSIFPLDLTGKDAPTLDHLQRVAGVFNGDDPIRNQLHLDFQPYDFAHIPVETLSVIYEQFLHAEGKGKDSGAYYTPVPLVDFMLQELEDHSPLGTGRRVFDASCGSGAFLVQCYRRMIEQHLRQSGGERPKPSELRELLVKNVYGMDEDEDACRVAELSLILTMFDYIEPPDLSTNPDFKIPDLHNVNIFHGDFFASDSRFSTKEAEKFDWVVGNPPWVKLKDDRPEDRTVLRWMEAHGKECPTGGNQAAEAFAWKVADNLAPGGVAGLLLPAMTLFKYESKKFRQKFFTAMKVWCVANFANLAEVLFAGRSRVPAAAFFYSHRSAEEPLEDILTFAPFVANQEANRPINRRLRKITWNIVVNASEVQIVPAELAAEGDQLPWKAAMWGSARDQKLIKAVSKRFPQLRVFAQRRGIHIHEGFQLRGKDEPAAEFIKELVDKKILQMDALRNCGRIFVFPTDAFGTITQDRAYLRIRGGKRGLTVCRPPHVIVDADRRFAVFSEEFVAVPARQIGIAGAADQTAMLKALSIFLISDFSVYFQFFASPGWGVKRERATLRALKEVPVPFEQISAEDLEAWGKLHSNFLSLRGPEDLFTEPSEKGRDLEDLLRELNDRTFSILKLKRSERWLVEDLVRVRLPLDEGKLGREAVDPPKVKELEKYAATLESELDSFLEDDARHEARVVYDGHSAMVEIRLGKGSGSRKKPDVLKADLRTSREFGRARKLLRRKHSQWLYFDRDLIMFAGDLTYLFKPMQRVHWTRSQAAVDADQIISETLTSPGE
jgi:methylase of polypeptide subunit release factors